jgi:phenylpyruvate tautomerase PptA (4-oxalocrotonate tautomerase family)
MPVSIQLSSGLLTTDGERQIFARVAEALLDVHGLASNAFMRANVIGHVSIVPELSSYVAGTSQSLAVIEIKVPSATFRDDATKQAFVTRVTDIVDELKAGAHPRARTYVNVSYAVDGTWGIGGHAYSNEDLGRAIAGAAVG